MQSFHVSVPVLNQLANFAAVITARTRIDKRKSADGGTLTKCWWTVGGIEPTYVGSFSRK